MSDLSPLSQNVGTAPLSEFLAEWGDTYRIKSAELNTRNPMGSGPIHTLAGRNEVSLLEEAILKGESVNARGEFQWTPLHYAACSEAWAAIEKLVAMGADPSLRDDADETPGDMLSEKQGVPAHIMKLLGAARSSAAPQPDLKDKR